MGRARALTAEIAYAYGLELVLWTEGSQDWRGYSAAEILERVEPGLQPGSIVLMHDGIGTGALRSGCAETVTFVGALVEHIRFLGYEPGPLNTTYTAGTLPTDVASAEQEGPTET